METTGKSPYPGSPGFSTLNTRNWQLEYSWVIGKYENPNGVTSFNSSNTPAQNLASVMAVLQALLEKMK